MNEPGFVDGNEGIEGDGREKIEGDDDEEVVGIEQVVTNCLIIDY